MFFVLIGVGILAFVMTLNVREESMPPIPSTEWYMHDLKNLGDQVKDYVREDDAPDESAPETAPTSAEPAPDANP